MTADFIIGPQLPISNSYFDQTQVTRGKIHGEACPAIPPTDDAGLNSFILLHYYDLPLTMYIAHKRTNDPTFLTLARKAADSWWKHPTWIGEGSIRLWPDAATPPPRHAGIGGLILRALDGRPEMWDWIVGYTQAHLDMWCKIRIKDSQLYYGPREVAFSMQHAAWVAKTLPDSHPNAAQIRTQLIADLENLVVNYTGRLQYPDGSWRENSDWVDADGGTMIGVMQPFIIGLLTSALADVHQVIASETAKESTKNQILKACRHLYSDGPYAKDLIEQKSGKRVRGFHYFYHGGTTKNPTKYENGDMVAPWSDLEGWWVMSTRQAIGTILPGFGYAYLLTNDPYFKSAYEEMYDSAYSGSDGFRADLVGTPKNYNQHCRRVPASLAWIGGVIGTPTPLPAPAPTPTPTTPAVESPNNTRIPTATQIVDSTGAIWTFTTNGIILRNGQGTGGQGSILLYCNRIVYAFGTDSQWYKWGNGWTAVGVADPCASVTPIPTPVPPAPTPTPVPAPTTPALRKVEWPSGEAKQNAILDTQWKDRYRFKRHLSGAYAEFEKVP